MKAVPKLQSSSIVWIPVQSWQLFTKRSIICPILHTGKISYPPEFLILSTIIHIVGVTKPIATIHHMNGWRHIAGNNQSQCFCSQTNDTSLYMAATQQALPTIWAPNYHCCCCQCFSHDHTANITTHSLPTANNLAFTYYTAIYIIAAISSTSAKYCKSAEDPLSELINPKWLADGVLVMKCKVYPPGTVWYEVEGYSSVTFWIMVICGMLLHTPSTKDKAMT